MAVQTLDKVTARPVGKPERPKRDRKAEAARRAQKAAKVEPAKPGPKPARDFYADLESGDIVAQFVATHGRWETWHSYIKTEAGSRTVQDRKLVPCECAACTTAIAEKGWTF